MNTFQQNVTSSGKKVMSWIGSYQDFLELSKETSPSHAEISYNSWAGVFSSDQANEVLDKGWERALEGLKEIDSTLRPADKIVKRPIWSEFGDSMSLNKLYSGDLRCFRTMKKRPSASPRFVSLVFPFVASCGTSEKEFLRNVQNLLEVAQTIEATGVRVEIIASGHTDQGTTDSQGRYQTYTCFRVKEFSEELNLRCISAIGHPCMTRVHWFKAILALVKNTQAAGNQSFEKGFGYGMCTLRKSMVREAMLAILDTDKVVVLPGSDEGKWDSAKIISEIFEGEEIG